MKKFRGKEVIGWRITGPLEAQAMEDKINDLMEKYNFEDYQFAANDLGIYSAILISKKEE